MRKRFPILVALHNFGEKQYLGRKEEKNKNKNSPCLTVEKGDKQ